jgi:hypothetical protein
MTCGANRSPLMGMAMSHDEIGAIIGAPRSTVGDIERRAMDKIRRMRTPAAQRMLGYFEQMSERSGVPEEYRISDEVAPCSY